MRIRMLFKQVFCVKITVQASSQVLIILCTITLGGGGVYSGCQVTGMIEWGQKSNPKNP